MTASQKLPSLTIFGKENAVLKSSDVAAVLTALAGQREEYDEGWMLAIIAVAASLKLRIVSERIGEQP